MALLTNSCESALATGTALTGGNSDDGSAGDAFSTSVGATSTIAYSSVQKAHGSLSHLFTTATGESNFIQWTITSSTSASARFYVRATTTPSASSGLASIRNSATAASVLHGSDGIIKILNASSANLVTGWSAISLNTWYRVEIVVTRDAVSPSTTNGRVQAKYFTLDSTSAVGTYDSGFTTNVGTTDFIQVRFGRYSGVATSASQVFYLDDYAAQDSSSFLGPVGANVPPTVTPTASTVFVVKNATGTISWSEADSDGTIASRVVTHVSGPDNPSPSSPTTTSRSYTFATQGTHVYKIVATDNGGADSADAFITVHVTDTTAVPASIAANTGPYTNEGGAGSLTAALGDASNTTYAESPDNPSGSAITTEHKPIGLGAVTVTTKDACSDASATPAITRTVELMQGATVIASTSFVLTNTITTHTFTTSSPQTAAITTAGRATLWVRVTDTI